MGVCRAHILSVADLYDLVLSKKQGENFINFNKTQQIAEWN